MSVRARWPDLYAVTGQPEGDELPAADQLEELVVDVRMDRRAADTARELMCALRRRAVVAARARVGRTRAGAWGGVVSERLARLDDEISELRRALRERPWTEEF